MGIRSPYVRGIFSHGVKGMRIAAASDVGHWSRDGGIPRFTDLPPSPFRGNDSGFQSSTPIFHSAQTQAFRDGTAAVPYDVNRVHSIFKIAPLGSL